MTTVWEWLFGRDCTLSMWIEEKELGKDRAVWIGKKRHTVVIPARLGGHQLIRYRGIGKTRWGKTGDVYVDAWLNKGEDVHANLWLSRSCAASGADKKITLDGRTLTVVVPPYCHDGQTIRLSGYGKKPGGRNSPPLYNPRRGNALVHLRLYDDTIVPRYGSFEALSTDDMALEGWVFNRIDQVIKRMAAAGFPEQALPADHVADVFNEYGWYGVQRLMTHHLGLDRLPIDVRPSPSLDAPGRCQQTVSQTKEGDARSVYDIEIKESFLDNPFCVAAILAHELCHVLYATRLDDTPDLRPGVARETLPLEVERTVDLLVFMFKVGEFQLRVARDQAFTLGYFHQDVFERMQVIAQKGLARLASR